MILGLCIGIGIGLVMGFPYGVIASPLWRKIAAELKRGPLDRIDGQG